jgi:CheY-like chemotaxis protein
VLVVDDNHDTAHGMARLLRASGYQVELAHDGPTAVERARAGRPSAILLDIGMPGMDGYEVAKQLRQEDWCRGTVLIAVSGYGQAEDRERSRQAGFDHHLVKPVDYETLLPLLDRRTAVPYSPHDPDATLLAGSP